MKNDYEHVKHEFDPIFDDHSRVLILGTLPSVKSRENKFYYGHPQNRFWKVLARVCGEKTAPVSVAEKTEFLLRNRIALWDVIEECDIIGSGDSSIRNVVPADMRRILDHAPIEKIYANGQTAYRLYMKYIYPDIGIAITKLPSTSPANAAVGLDDLAEIWSKELNKI